VLCLSSRSCSLDGEVDSKDEQVTLAPAASHAITEPASDVNAQAVTRDFQDDSLREAL
jgi:hypothetical protein